MAKIFSPSENQKRNIIKLSDKYIDEDLDDEINGILSSNKLKLSDTIKDHQEIIEAVSKLISQIEANNTIPQ